MSVAYLNLIATGIVFNIRASSSHIGRMMAFSEHRRWIICVFDWRSIMNRLYWHNQQVGYLCFIPFVWEQRGVIAAVAHQTAMISHLLPMCWATWGWLWGHVGAVWEPRIDRVNWHSRYSGTRYSGTWLYFVICRLFHNLSINWPASHSGLQQPTRPGRVSFVSSRWPPPGRCFLSTCGRCTPCQEPDEAGNSKHSVLIHCGLVTPYGVIDLSQH